MKFILTGGPCSGKTSVLESLAQKGAAVLPEQARTVITEEQKKEAARLDYLGVLPWRDYYGFEELVFSRQLQAEEQEKRRPLFLDRSLVDVLAYCRAGSVQSPPGLKRAIWQAGYSHVFLFDPLQYCADAQRLEDPKLAGRIHRTLTCTYKELGFEITAVPVPPGSQAKSVEAHVKIVLE